MSGDPSPMELLAEEVEGEDDYARLRAFKRIRVVAEALGPEATEAQLLPFLLEKSGENTEDEVLMVIAKELGAFLPLVKSPEVLLPPLTNLAAAEETVVREAAVRSIIAVLTAITGPVPAGLGIFKTLTSAEWFCPKLSASALFSSIYAKTSTEEQKEEMRHLLETILADDTPMVRKAVAASLPDLVKVVSLDVLASWVVPMYKKLVADDQDTVRIAAIEASVHVAKGLQQTGIDEQNILHVVPVVRSALEDRSWRVRLAIAKDFTELCKAIVGEGGQRTTEILNHDLIPAFQSLLQDNEGEVRAAACKNFAPFLDVVGPTVFVQQLVPTIQALAPDTIPGVRLALSSACLDLAPKLGQDVFVRHLLPLLEKVLSDTTTPDVKVRLNVLQRLEVIGTWLPSLVDSLLPIILLLRDDDNWRIRKAVLEVLPVLAAHLGMEYFETRLLERYFSAFKDRICEVRLAATGSLAALAKVAGGDWVLAHVMPRLKTLYQESSFYLIRVAVLNSLRSLAVEGSPEPLLQEILSLLLTASQDRIPNVRFTAAQVLAALAKQMDDATVHTQIRPSLTEMSQSDPDDDVRFYAVQALEVCG